MADNQRYTRFKDFYPFYLSEHQNRVCKLLHFIGSFLILVLIGYVIQTGNYVNLIYAPLIGYGFAWIGHFGFEKNRPATFQYPLYSLAGDWVMFKDILIGRVKI